MALQRTEAPLQSGGAQLSSVLCQTHARVQMQAHMHTGTALPSDRSEPLPRRAHTYHYKQALAAPPSAHERGAAHARELRIRGDDLGPQLLLGALGRDEVGALEDGLPQHV